jgi:argininosuccinate lyase
LVRACGVPFREAHHITGAAVRIADERSCALWELPLEALQEADGRIDGSVFDVLSVTASVRSRTSHGGTAPSEVMKRVKAAKKTLGMEG